MDFTYRPIDAWPGEETSDWDRKRANFSAGYGRTLEQLDRELGYLDASLVVLQVAVDESQIRRDGKPRASARYAHPGCILAFESRYGPLKYACDTFDRLEDNIRAITLGLEALRKVERYGITKRGEQYTGWKQIGSGRTTGEAMTREQAWRVLCDLADRPEELPELASSGPPDFERLFRLASKLHHPDQGGDRTMFEAATEARAVLLK